MTVARNPKRENRQPRLSPRAGSTQLWFAITSLHDEGVAWGAILVTSMTPRERAILMTSTSALARDPRDQQDRHYNL